MTQAALLGGLFIGVLSALPIVNVANCCCLWIVAGGALAAHLVQESDQNASGAARGAVAGLLAGIVGAVVWLVVSAVLGVLLAPLQERVVGVMVRSTRDMPPDVRDWFGSLGDGAMSPMRLAVGFLAQLFAGVVFSTLGGVLGAAVFRPDRGPAQAVVPPPLPPS